MDIYVYFATGRIAEHNTFQELLSLLQLVSARTQAGLDRASKPFKYVLGSGFEYDVKKRVPEIDKAKKILGFNADNELSTMLEEVIPWIKSASKAGQV